MSVLLHPATQIELERYTQQLSAVNVVVGPHGTGKTHAIRKLVITREPAFAERIQNGTWENLIHIDLPEERSLGIDTIKELEQLLQLHTTSNRYVLISKSERLTFEAQNAFLKTLEESPANTYVFLLVPHEENLLQTIRSRAQIIRFHAPTKTEFIDWLTNTFNVTEQQAKELYYTTESAAETSREILTNTEEKKKHDLLVTNARAFLQKDTAGKLALLEPHLKDRTELTAIISYINRLCRAALWATAQSGRNEQASAWSKRLLLLQETERLVEENINSRLVAAHLVVNWQ